ncbi:outer membrane beta-barrel protein [Flavitalea sp.]|nr:TonB-dependent receptor [Flavitalea sp.]
MKPVFIILLLFTCLSVAGQSISGKLVDSLSRQPAASATITLYSSDSLLKQTVISDSLGIYHFKNIQTGTYILSYTMVGYSSKSFPLIVKDTGSILVDDVLLAIDRNLLQAVTVTGKRPVLENKNDGIIYNAINDIAMAGASAADLLKRIPVLNVDQNGNVSITGKMSLRVFIDNKPSDIYGSSVADALKQIPAEEIEKVEVITSPSAKYEAEGADAVILITTKKSRLNGKNGNLRTLIKTFNRELSAGLKVRKNSISYGLDGGFYSNYFKFKEEAVREDLDALSPTTLVQDTRRRNEYWSYYLGFNLTKMLDSLKSFSVGYRFRDGKFNNKTSTYNDFAVKGVSYSQYSRDIDLNSSNTGHSINSGYTAKSANKKNELNLLGYFFTYKGTEDYDLNQTRNALIDYNEISRGWMDNRELSIQADDIYKFSDKTKIETGARAVFRYFGSANNLDVYSFSDDDYRRDELRSNDFSYHRAIYAAYLNYSFTVKKWEIRAGGRFELTTLNADFKDKSLAIPGYNNFIPDFLINRKIGERNSIRLSYKKNILRPYLYQLNPNVNYTDSLNISYGNPDLVPAIQHGFQLVHSFTKQPWFWSNTLFLNSTRNNVESIRLIRPGGIMETTYQNIGKYMDLGIMTSLALNRQTGFGFNISGNLRYVKLSSEALQQSSEGFTYGTNINISYRFNSSFGIEGNARLNSRTIYLQGYETRWKQHGISINKKFFRDKLNITAGSDDFFVKYQKVKSVTKSGTLVQSSSSRYPSRIFRIGVTYSFGKKDLVVHQARSAEEL